MPQMSPMNWLYLYIIIFFFGCWFFFLVWYHLNLTVMKLEKKKVFCINYINKW